MNVKNDDGHYERFHINTPIGLLLHIMGIAVGYATNILPRKYEDIVDYISGNLNDLNPYFKDFDGLIEYKNINNKDCWLLSSVFVINNNKTLNISDLPPMIKFSNFLNKIDDYIQNFNINVDVQNMSSNKCNILIKFRDEEYSWEKIQNRYIKIYKNYC